MKVVCIYHSVDLDGWMSAAIVRLAHTGDIPKNLLHTDINFIGYNYGDPIPDLSEYDKVIMTDISLSKEEMLVLNKRLGENLVWIDHHQRTVNEVNAFIVEHGIPMEGLVTTDGELKAACELTWEYFFSDKPMPEIVRLLGMYDSFRHKLTPEEQKVLEFQYGARQCISNPDEAYRELTHSLQYLPIKSEIPILESGKSIYKYLCTEAKQIYAARFSYFYAGEHIACVNRERFNPINFGIDYHKDEYDAFMCFHFANGLWNFSIYNDNGHLDVSLIAKYFGGGGHKGASGFRLTTELFIDNFFKISK
jgi:oligoribonuclease NrnB/cAMP/cGMP phosphodiesterase (DHH superfamily)